MIKSILTLLLFLMIGSAAAEEGWQDLFNGKNLDGWKQLNGKATYKVENNEIVGITVLNTPNSFLCTEETYSDFILELEVYVDAAINSGIQIRSNTDSDYYNGIVHGYQVEIDPSLRAFSGGIYDEGRRGWIYPLTRNKTGRRAFKNGSWNTYRIEAIGNTIRTWINGVQCSNLVDALTAKGFIGLQVHSIWQEDNAGRTIRWRNIRIKTSNLENSRMPVNPQVPEVNMVPNLLTEREKRRGWRLLWDGESFSGWTSVNKKDLNNSGWKIKDGILTISESSSSGDIVTTDEFADFELKVDFSITDGANSGIKYLVAQDGEDENAPYLGLEYQILDDKRHPDAKQGVDGNRTLASLYDLIPAENLSVPGRGKDFRGDQRWNTARIVVKGDMVEHWLNEFKLVEYNRSSPVFRALVAKSKYRDIANFGLHPLGRILLQDHGNRVSFRSIKVREL